MKRSYRDILDFAARQYIPDDTNLFPRIAARLERKTLMQTLRARPALALLIVLLALTLLTGVVYAIGRSLGYIPGVGIVEPSAPLRVLMEPVSQTRQGITVTVEEAIADSQRTMIVYKTEGLTIAAANSQGEGGGPSGFGSKNLLRLPDRTVLEESLDTGYNGTPEPLINDLQTEGGWPNSVSRLVYPSVSPEINELTLVIPVLQNMPAGAAPENWEITFHLKPAPPEMTYAPITVLPPLNTTEAISSQTQHPALSNVATKNGFTFRLDNVVELKDGFVFTGNLSWDDSVFPTGKGRINEAVIPTLTDADGQQIPIEEVQLNAVYDEHNMPWSYRTNRKAFSGPLTFTIPSISTTYEAPGIQFSLDLGDDPQVGQTWVFNHDFQVEGRTIRLLSVEMGAVPQDCQGIGVIFKFSAADSGISINVGEVVPQEPMACAERTRGGGGGGPFDPSLIYSGITYKDVPGGLHQYSINVSVPNVISGPWQVVWTAPTTSEPVPTAAPKACLTSDQWNQLSVRDDPLPSGVGGKLLTTVSEGGPLPAIYLKGLDGTNVQKVAIGGWPSVSNDGTHLAYSAGDGIHVVDLSTGQNSALETDGYRIIWSPDDTRLMFTTTFNLYVVKADGSGLQKVDIGQAQVISPVGWLPDKQTVVYSVLTGEGFELSKRNLQSGETQALFTIHNKAGYAALSSDGQWIVFADRIFGASNWGIFISHLDGSERRLVAEPEVPTAFTSVWGPDGQWLILNTVTMDPLTKAETQTPVLVNPFSCQAVRVNFDGMVEGWSR